MTRGRGPSKDDALSQCWLNSIQTEIQWNDLKENKHVMLLNVKYRNIYLFFYRFALKE